MSSFKEPTDGLVFDDAYCDWVIDAIRSNPTILARKYLRQAMAKAVAQGSTDFATSADLTREVVARAQGKAGRN